MAIRIGSNIESLQAQRRLGDSSASLSKVYEKLSSGQRINRASDDAAGLAIAETLNAASRVFTQGVRNVNDASSYYTIAQAASTELKSIIIRGKELAEQSANGSYSDAQRCALNNELQAIGREFNRILESTTFNGRQIFSKDNARLQTQAGESTLDTSLQSERAAALDQIQRVSIGLGGAEADGGSESHSSGATTAAISADGRYVTFQSDASNLVAGDTNGNWDIFVKDLQTGDIQRVSTTSAGGESNGQSFNASISADGRYVTFQSDASNLVAGDANGRDDIFVKDLQTGNIQRLSTTSAGGESNESSSSASISADGRYVTFESVASNLVAGDTNGWGDSFVKDLQTGEIRRVSVSQSGREGMDSWDGQGGCKAAISADGKHIFFTSDFKDLLDGGSTGDINSVYTTTNPFANVSQLSRFQWVNIKTQSEARNALPWLDSYLTELGSYQGTVGATLSRLSTAANVLSSSAENFKAAESRIRDADIAAESASFMRLQIAQQAATAVLAQANQQPALAVTLLKAA